MSAINSAALDNALMAQKDAAIKMIDSATDLSRIKVALVLIDLLALSWDVVGYGYKAQELRRRLRFQAGVSKEFFEDQLIGEKAQGRKASRNNVKLLAEEIAGLTKVMDSLPR